MLQPPEGKPQIVAAFGRRGSGKTAWLKQTFLVPTYPRLAMWDFKTDPALRDIGKAYTDQGAFVRAMRAETFQVRYLVDLQEKKHTIEEQFELFCMACFEVGCMRMYVAELPEVSKASRAPKQWKRCINVGRDYFNARGMHCWLSIAADAQRPAEVDKTFISNADIIHSGALMNLDDAQYLSKTLFCKPEELLALQNLEYIERNTSTSETVRGRLTFDKKPQKKSAQRAAQLAQKATP